MSNDNLMKEIFKTCTNKKIDLLDGNGILKSNKDSNCTNGKISI